MARTVVGIAGGTASGKTTVARGVVAALDGRATLLEHDRYYRSVPSTVGLGKWNFDHPDSLETELLREHVAAWLRGESIDVPSYDFALQRRKDRREWSTLPACDVLVVEGILIFTDPALCETLDVRFFVHAPDDIRLARRLRRDIAERGRGVDDILEQYMATVRPMHEQFVVPSQEQAHATLSGMDPVPSLVQQVLSRLPTAS